MVVTTVTASPFSIVGLYFHWETVTFWVGEIDILDYA